MLFPRQVSFFTIFRSAFAIMLALLLVASCTIPKKYQRNLPFVYKTVIDIDGPQKGPERQKLKAGLENQLSDSLKVRTIVAFGFPALLYNKLQRPPVFDSGNVSRSKASMTALLNSVGYFGPAITDTFFIDTVRDQQRVKVQFRVTPGRQLKLDSIGYEFTHPEFQNLAIENRGASFLKKGEPYSIQVLSSELDRLLLLFRNHGYYKIVKEDFIIERDTVLAALIDPSLDPFEQFTLLDELKRKKENPTINVAIKQARIKDSTHYNKFYVGDVRVYPDMNIQEEIAPVEKTHDSLLGIQFYYRAKKFKLPYLSRNVTLRPGALYKIEDYYATVNNFNQSGAWGQVDVAFSERQDSVPLLDAGIRLYPAKKQSLNIAFEASRNTGTYLSTGQLFGTGLNIGLLNRNAFREAVQSTTSLQFGIELGRNIIQTLQSGISQNIYIPRFILPFKVKNENKLSGPKTAVSLGAAYTKRLDFYDVRSAKASWGYEWGKKKHAWRYIPFNIEYTEIIKTDSFLKLEEEIPSLKIAFNNGFIISQIVSYNYDHGSRYNHGLLKTRFEESGAIFGLIKALDRGELRRFIKADVEYKYLIDQPKSTWAFRAFGGYGYSYGQTKDGPEQYLPFFKAYFGGGPYTMRAWQVRQLGLGSNNFYDTLQGGIDRFGDIQMESNVEYRFDLATLFGIKFKSAFFVDIGNIWNSSNFDNEKLEGSELTWKNFYKDIAVGGGTSLRIDFDFFLIRLDWAYKLKDPIYSYENAGWFNKLKITSGQLQFGIGYPF
jgi:outer membrane protein insertion porin family